MKVEIDTKSKEDKEREDKWKAEEDSRTLMEYAKIYKDKKRLNRAKEELKKKIKDINAAIKD